VGEYVRFFAGARAAGRALQSASAVRGALGRAGLEADAPIESLGPGERTALALTAALLIRPSVLLLDDLFRHVDQARRAAFLLWLGEAREAGTTMVLATCEDDGAVVAPCSRVVRLEAGRIADRRAVGATTDAKVGS